VASLETAVSTNMQHITNTGFNFLKTYTLIHIEYKNLFPHSTEKTLHIHYKDNSVNAVWGSLCIIAFIENTWIHHMANCRVS